MPNVVGNIPPFTDESKSDKGSVEEVKKAPDNLKVGEQEKGTPAETPAVEKPVEKVDEITRQKEEWKHEKRGMEAEKSRLISEIASLREQKRKEKQPTIGETKEEFLTKGEYARNRYNDILEEQKNLFLESHPEYQPGSKENDERWDKLNQELIQWYKLPENPYQVNDLLEKIHADITKPSGERDVASQKKQIETAGIGGSKGVSHSPSRRPFTPLQREMYRRGGFTDEEINELETKRK